MGQSRMSNILQIIEVLERKEGENEGNKVILKYFKRMCPNQSILFCRLRAHQVPGTKDEILE